MKNVALSPNAKLQHGLNYVFCSAAEWNQFGEVSKFQSTAFLQLNSVTIAALVHPKRSYQLAARSSDVQSQPAHSQYIYIVIPVTARYT